MGGYQDVCIGIGFTLGSTSWSVNDFWGDWVTWHKDCKWTEAERNGKLGEIVIRVAKLLSDANVDTINRLVGVPIEVDFDDNILKSWRILTEAI